MKNERPCHRRSPAPAGRQVSWRAVQSAGFAVGTVIGAASAVCTIQAIAMLRPAPERSTGNPVSRLPQCSPGLRLQLASVNAELAMERAAGHAMQAHLASLQRRVSGLRDQLAFYEHLLPSGPAGVPSVRALQFVRVPDGLRYRLMLVRNGQAGGRPFRGALRFRASGMHEGKAASISLREAAASCVGRMAGKPSEAAKQHKPGITGLAAGRKSEPLALPCGQGYGGHVFIVLDRHLVREGVLELPAGFVPSDASVEVLHNDAVVHKRAASVAGRHGAGPDGDEAAWPGPTACGAASGARFGSVQGAGALF